ncbi:hypothetical protein AB0I54_31740 [Streptomyces sp. NPDC050625]|uniref:hypothetical protein n=1 Tax=Streptomyces sp. NPDC050625 TaxID=3154629 RepID=UPI003417F4B3
MSQPYPHQPPPQPPRQFNWTKWAIWTTAAAAAAFGIGGAIATTTRDNQPSAAACKTALERGWDRYDAERAAGRDPGMQDPPPACIGLDKKTLEKITGEIMDKKLREGLDDAVKDLETAQP